MRTSYSLTELAGMLVELSSQANRRVIVGIVGSPGSGKSTLALQLHRQLGPSSAVIPMDGFHLSQQQLEDQGKANRKGAPDTFDVDGFLHILTRVREEKEEVYIPAFDRSQENPIAASILITSVNKIIVVEGNYLLLSQPRWNQVESFLDTKWFLNPSFELRLQRLVHRHISHGKSQAEAERWVSDVDEINATLIEQDMQRADLVIKDFHS